MGTKIKIGEICDILNGYAFKSDKYVEEGIRIIRIANVQKGYLEDSTPQYYPLDTAMELSKYMLEENDLLMSLTGNVGRVALLTAEMLPAALNQRVACLRIKDYSLIRKDFLYQLLNSDYFEAQCILASKGIAQKNLSTEWLKEYEIPLFTQEEQIAISKELMSIDSLITARREQLAKLDELVKSRFIEMFGNLVIGDKICTNKHKIGEIASVTKLAGFEFTKYIQYKEQGDIIMLRGLNCKKGHLVLDDIKWIDKETSDLLPRSKLYYGDILMTYAGTIGDVAMVDADDKYHLAPNVAKITLTDKMAYNPVFLIHLFMYTNDYIMTFASVVAQASINMEKIRNFEYYFPSVEQQNAFATFVEQIDKSKFEIQKSLQQLETLKKALMQKYFG